MGLSKPEWQSSRCRRRAASRICVRARSRWKIRPSSKQLLTPKPMSVCERSQKRHAGNSACRGPQSTIPRRMSEPMCPDRAGDVREREADHEEAGELELRLTTMPVSVCERGSAEGVAGPSGTSVVGAAGSSGTCSSGAASSSAAGTDATVVDTAPIGGRHGAADRGPECRGRFVAGTAWSTAGVGTAWPARALICSGAAERNGAARSGAARQNSSGKHGVSVPTVWRLIPALPAAEICTISRG